MKGWGLEWGEKKRRAFPLITLKKSVFWMIVKLNYECTTCHQLKFGFDLTDLWCFQICMLCMVSASCTFVLYSWEVHNNFKGRGRVFFPSSRKEVIMCCSAQIGWKIKPLAIIEEFIICHSLICHQVSVITFIITGIYFGQSSTALAVSRPDCRSETEVEGFFKISITG